MGNSQYVPYKLNNEDKVMIINTGGRTDTVNYYSDWLLKRFEEGVVYARNPLFPNHVTKYLLDPDVVDCVVFCSKNYRPIIKNLTRITGRFNVFCHYTITAYDKDIEPNVPTIDESIKTLIELSNIVGQKKVAWRYDPILLTAKYTVQKHLATFDYMASQIAPHVSCCIFSFVEMYKRLGTNMPELIQVTDFDKQILAKGIGETAKKYGLRIQTCGTEDSFKHFGIETSGCMTTANLSDAIGCQFKQMAHKGTRIGCSCMPSRDIGAYNTCLNSCKYCYANKKPQSVLENYKKHDPNSTLLVGHILPTDIIKEGMQKSFILKDKIAQR